MKSNLAQIAYDGYCKQSGGVSLVSGAPLPEFSGLQDEIKVAWNEAAQAVAAVVTGCRFELDAEVQLKHSPEKGVVIARAQYARCEASYLVRYQAADGRQVEAWWQDSAIA